MNLQRIEPAALRSARCRVLPAFVAPRSSLIIPYGSPRHYIMTIFCPKVSPGRLQGDNSAQCQTGDEQVSCGCVLLSRIVVVVTRARLSPAAVLCWNTKQGLRERRFPLKLKRTLLWRLLLTVTWLYALCDVDLSCACRSTEVVHGQRCQTQIAVYRRRGDNVFPGPAKGTQHLPNGKA